MAVPFYFMLIWTIYGYVLAKSPENDCGLTEESIGWKSLMTINLVIGTWLGATAVFVTFCVTIILHCKPLRDAFIERMILTDRNLYA